MVPPPDNTGDEFPDFENMTPEQQMAWLESLARRQGAKAEEFTTSADMDIAVPDNPVIDEPGYVPFSVREGLRKPQPDQPQEPEQPAALPHDVEQPQWSARVEEFPAEEEAPAPVEDAADPMHWLNSLAARPAEELDDLALDLDLEQEPEPADEGAQVGARGEIRFESEEEAGAFEFDFGVDEYDVGLDEEFELQADTGIPAMPGSVPEAYGESFEQPAPEPEAAEPPVIEPAAGLSDDPLGGMDPMKWLETLAARQGASREELTTSADLEIPEVSGDVTIDEPGYVPYDVTEGARRQRAWHEEEEAPPAVQPTDLRPEPETAEGAGLGEGAEFEPVEADLADESLSWLADLAAGGDADVSGELLALDEDFMSEMTGAGADAFPAPAADDPLAGMTDEEIARAQARGELTGAQEYAWLQRQAAKLAETRQYEEVAPEVLEEEEIEPAEPAVLPDWLQEMRATMEAETEQDIPIEELPIERAELPDWLAEAAPEETGLALEADVDSLWAETPAAEEVSAIEEPIPDSELAAYLAGELPQEPDQLAEALDAEFERVQVGDDSEPEWYAQAVQGAEAQLAAAPEVPEEPLVEAEPELTEAEMIDMPDWLKASIEEPEAEPAPAEPPSWLAEPAATQEAVPAIEAEDLPDWLREMVDQPEAEPEPDIFGATPPPIAVSTPPVEPQRVPTPEPELVSFASVEAEIVPAPREAAIPSGELFQQYRERLEGNPNDAAARLGLARALSTNQQVPASLDHYDVLIDTQQLLQDVLGDLTGLMSSQPENPRVRRLLGDAYMRLGRLQDALDAYRSALDQL